MTARTLRLPVEAALLPLVLAALLGVRGVNQWLEARQIEQVEDGNVGALPDGHVVRVLSLGFERLTVQRPYAERLIGPRVELACRLSANFSLGVTSRIQRNEITGKLAPSVVVQLAMKTVN